MTNALDIFTLAARFRNRLMAGEMRATSHLVNAYGRAYQRLQGDVDALIGAMGELPEPTWGQIERLGLYRNLKAQIRTEIGRYAVFAEGLIGNEAQTAIGLGLSDSSALVLANYPGAARAVVQGSLSVLVPEQVYAMLGFLQRQSPLYVKLNRLGDDVAEVVAEKLRQGIILGFNPRRVAASIRSATGQGLTWSLRTARTANLNAYREATHANFLANSHVVKSWIWTAALGDGRTCMSCISKHGHEFPLATRLNDHHSGRCAARPKTITFKDLGLNVSEPPQSVETGEAWFRRQTATVQQQYMGNAMWKAWRDEQFGFEELSRPYQDDVYGELLREASLKDLLGEQAKRYYARHK